MPFRLAEKEEDNSPKGFRPIEPEDQPPRGFKPVEVASRGPRGRVSESYVRSLQQRLLENNNAPKAPSKNASYRTGLNAFSSGDKAQALADWRQVKPGDAEYAEAQSGIQRLSQEGRPRPSVSKKSTSLYQQAFEAFTSRDSKQAELLASQAVAEDPNNLEAVKFLQRIRGGARASIPRPVISPAKMPGNPYLAAAKQFLVTDPAAGADVLRDELVNLIAPDEGELESRAAATGKVPYGRIAGRTGAELLAENIPLTPTDVVLTGLALPALRGAGVGAEAAGRALFLDKPMAAAAKFLRAPRKFPFRNVIRPEIQAADDATAAILEAEPGPVSTPTPAAAPGVASEDDVLREIIVGEAGPPMPAGTGLPKVAPPFNTATERDRLIKEMILKKEGDRVGKRLSFLNQKINRIRDIRAGKAGDLPASPDLAINEMRLIESDAVAELEAAAKAMRKEARSAMGGPTTLEEFVAEQGGIRSYRPDPRTDRPIEIEDWQDLPKRFRAGKGAGQAPDIVAQNAYDAGLLVQPSDKELLRQLKDLPDRGRVEAWRAYMPEAERLALNPDSNLPLARRFLDLRSAAGDQLPGTAAKAGMNEAQIQREIDKLAKQWEAKRAQVEGIKTGKAGPDVVGVDVEEGWLTAPEMAGNVRVTKFPGEEVRYKIRQAADELGLGAGQPYGGRRTFEETGLMADELLAKGVRAKDMLRIPRGTALNDSEMRAMQVLTDDSFRQAQKAEDLARAAAGRPEAQELERKAAEAWEESKAVLDRMSEFKTTSGRAVSIQRTVSPEDIDLPTVYMQKVSESETAKRLVGPERTDYLREVYDEFMRLPKDRQLLLFEKEQDLGSFEEFRRNWIKPTLNVWRASLVSQLMTAMRNFSSQTGGALWNIMDDAVAAVAGTAVRAARGEPLREAGRKASAGLVEDFTSFFRRFSSEDRKALDGILGQFPKLQEQLLGRSSFLEPEPTGTTMAARKFSTFTRKYGDYLTWLSRWGEKQQRLYFFEAGLRERIRRSYPEILQTMNFKGLPFTQFADVAQMAGDAADQAMRLTFSKEFDSGIAGGFLKAMRMPVIEELSALGGATFPRFMANAYSWLWRHGPGTGLAETLLSAKGRRGLLTGNPEAMKALAGSATGAMAFGAALYARSRPETSEGARWYEMKLGNGPDGKPKYVNTLAYSPLIAPYLFMAELALNGSDKMSARDIQQGILMIRIAGLGRFALDFLSGKMTGESAGRLAKSAAGEFIGGFFQPLQTIRDAVAGWDDEERKFRDTRQAPVMGPAMVRIPFMGKRLPEAVSPTRSGARESESPWLRQLTGFSVNTKNALEAKMADINFDTATLYPKLGTPRANWLVTAELGKIAEEIAPALLRRLEDETRDMRRDGRGEKEIKEVQRLRVSEAFNHWKGMAMNRARGKDPTLFQKLKIENARGKKRVRFIRSGQL